MKKIKVGFIGSLIIACLYLGAILYFNFFQAYEILLWHYVILGILFFLVTIFIFKFYSDMLICSIVGFLGIGYVFLTPYYSPIDEGAHFDYILHIVNQHSLPTLYDSINSEKLLTLPGVTSVPGDQVQYEAVHPPVYYFLAAMLIMPFNNDLVMSFVILRLFGVILAVLSVLFFLKAYKVLVEKNIIQESKESRIVFLVAGSIVFLSPGFLTRMATLSNESLVVLLATVLFYMLLKFDFHKINGKEVLMLGIISTLMVLTKFTSLFFIGIVFVVLVLYKKWKYLPLYLGTFVIGMLPWWIYNLTLYKSVTGTALHVEFVQSLVNPSMTHFDFIYILGTISRFMGTIWNPQEIIGSLIDPFAFIVSILNVMLVGAFFFVLIKTTSMRKIRGLDNSERKKEVVLVISFLSILFNVMILIYGTFTQNVDIMLGRYLYINLISTALILYFFIVSFINSKYWVYVAFVLIFIICILNSNFLHTALKDSNNMISKYINEYLERDLSLENYSEPKYKELLNQKDLEGIPFKLGEEVGHAIINDFKEIKFNAFHELDYDNQVITLDGTDPYIIYDLDSRNGYPSEYNLLLSLDDIHSKNGNIQVFWDYGFGFSEEDSVMLKADWNGNYLIPVGRNEKWNNNNEVLRVRIDFNSFNDASFKFNALYN